MVNTTVSVSKKFQSWLKGKGKKGESYEDIIKGLIKPDALKDLELYKEQEHKEDVIETKADADAKNEPDVVDMMLGGKLTEE